MQQELERVRWAAKKEKGLRFTALAHHVYKVDLLRAAYLRLRRSASPGVDGQTWQQYGEELEVNLQNLSERLKRGAYRAKPVRRAYIRKADGGRRPLGVPTLEDKIVQGATTEVLNAVYEVDFLGFSYGFRPERRQHMALDALCVGIERERVGWVLDADIRGFFDTIDHEWPIKFVEHRIGDQRIARLILKWLKAGVLEDGERRRNEEGTPQGGSISPLLANIYLHYVFDPGPTNGDVSTAGAECASSGTLTTSFLGSSTIGKPSIFSTLSGNASPSSGSSCTRTKRA